MDHTNDRSINWRDAAPKWLILAWGTLGWSIGGFLGVIVWNGYQDRMTQLELRATDPWKATLAQHSQGLGEVQRRVIYLEERVGRIEGDNLEVKIEKLSGQIERLSDRLSRNGF